MTGSSSTLDTVIKNGWRIVVGFLFWIHGAQKLFAWFGRDEPVALMSEFGVAGILEFFGGLLILFGLFTRPVAFILAGEMAVAYWWKHSIGRGSIFPWENGGELVALYCFTYLLMFLIGGGDFSLDGMIRRRKTEGA